MRQICSRFHVPHASGCSGPRGQVGSVLCAIGKIERGRGIRRNAGAELHDSAQGVASIKVGGAATKHFNAPKLCAWHTVPVHPAAKRIDHRHTVLKHQCTAGAACAHPSQRNALRGRVRNPAACPTEKGEAGYLAQHVVECQRRIGVQVLACKQYRVSGRFRQRDLATCRRDNDLFNRAEWTERDSELHRVRRRRPILVEEREAVCHYVHRTRSLRDRHEREAAISMRPRRGGELASA